MPNPEDARAAGNPHRAISRSDTGRSHWVANFLRASGNTGACRSFDLPDPWQRDFDRRPARSCGGTTPPQPTASGSGSGRWVAAWRPQQLVRVTSAAHPYRMLPPRHREAWPERPT